MAMRDDLYIYSARVHRIVDGDTVYFTVDLGFYIHHVVDCRLARINAPESNRRASKKEGLAATAHLEMLLNLGPIYIQTSKSNQKGKYGRWIVEILVQVDDEYFNVNDQMVEDGHAIYQEY